MGFIRESDLENICANCGKEHGSDFGSEWDEHSSFMHYKACNCRNCGYKVFMRTKYDTSGF